MNLTDLITIGALIESDLTDEFTSADEDHYIDLIRNYYNVNDSDTNEEMERKQEKLQHDIDETAKRLRLEMYDYMFEK